MARSRNYSDRHVSLKLTDQRTGWWFENFYGPKGRRAYKRIVSKHNRRFYKQLIRKEILQ